MKKIKYGCDTSYATCIITEITPNPQSSLLDVECISQQDFNEDVYEQLENIQTQSDLSELGEQCLTYTTLNNKNIVKNVILKFEEEICILKNKTEALENVDICNKDITSCNFSFGNLTTACGDQPQTLGEVIQLILDTLNTP